MKNVGETYGKTWKNIGETYGNMMKNVGETYGKIWKNIGVWKNGVAINGWTCTSID